MYVFYIINFLAVKFMCNNKVKIVFTLASRKYRLFCAKDSIQKKKEYWRSERRNKILLTLL